MRDDGLIRTVRGAVLRPISVAKFTVAGVLCISQDSVVQMFRALEADMLLGSESAVELCRKYGDFVAKQKLNGGEDER